jgi:MFS family permease
LSSRPHRQVLLLATAQALFQTASTLVMTVGALAGSQIASSPRLATVPIASMFLGTVLMLVPASIWMARAGRRTGFLLGAVLGIIGGVVAAAGIQSQSLPLLALGTMLIGSYQAFAQFYRFAAAEIADEGYRSRAISLVLAGGVAAAFLGPALATMGARLLPPIYMGSFLILALTCVLAALLLTQLKAPAPEPVDDRSQPRPLLAIVGQPAYLVALFGAATGSGVMILAMTATPLAMAHHGHGLPAGAAVIQAHVLGMFVPSFFTGALIGRFGIVPIMFAGIGLLSASVAMTLTGTGLASFGSALVLLGVGWNFLYVGGTSLLTRTYLPGERAKAQATNDLVVYLVGLASSLGSAALLEAVGWRSMNLLLVPWLLLALIAIVWLRRMLRGAPRSAGEWGTSAR